MLATGWTERLLSSGGTLGSRVERLCELCLTELGVSGAGVQVLAAGPHRLAVHATDRIAEHLEELQQELGEGPGVDAARTGSPALEADLCGTGARRWPWFAPGAVAHGAGAVFAWPVRVGAVGVGVLSLYRRRPGPLSRTGQADAVVLADAAAILLLDDRAAGSVEALVWLITDQSRFRPEVHQATGMLTVQLGLGVLDAYARLCAAAYADNRTMAQLSRDIVDRRVRLTAG